MSVYAVVKIERATGSVAAVIARGLEFHHADKFATELAASAVEPGHYITARNENDILQHQTPGR